MNLNDFGEFICWKNWDRKSILALYEERLGVKSGYRTTWELLEKAHGLEEGLAGKFEEMATQQTDPALNRILGDIVLRCRKNKDKIVQLLRELSSEDYQVTLKCPICGWGIPYGNKPAIGDERKCELCGVWFRLGEREGDYRLHSIGRKDRGQ